MAQVCKYKSSKCHSCGKVGHLQKVCRSKVRPVPYAMKPLVEKELDRLKREGVIDPIPFADWAAPIVSVLKSNKTVRICEDFKLRVNKMCKLNHYPIPE